MYVLSSIEGGGVDASAMASIALLTFAIILRTRDFFLGRARLTGAARRFAVARGFVRLRARDLAATRRLLERALFLALADVRRAFFAMIASSAADCRR
jgi:hypothetical protein